MVTEFAHAKVNLFLDVISRRRDGFHNIKTVMHSVSLADVIEVSAEPSEESSFELEILGAPTLPTDGNLAITAARCFLEAAKLTARVKIRLEKNIPLSAGLAGGSSDAAAVLRAMDKIFGVPLTSDELVGVASRIGSDVPYCLMGGTALCEGRGELITPLHAPRPMIFVIAIACESVSTPEAYSALDRLYSDFDGSVTRGGEAAYRALSDFLLGAPLPEKLYNIFEDAVLPECGGARDIKKLMLAEGAHTALMSGSGPSVFGVFDTEEMAESVKNKLLALGYRAYTAHSV